MNLENLNSKEPLIKEFFTWIFDDDSFVNKYVDNGLICSSSKVTWYVR